MDRPHSLDKASQDASLDLYYIPYYVIKSERILIAIIIIRAENR